MITISNMKKCLLHEDGSVRNLAVEYFSKGKFEDQSVRDNVLKIILESINLYPKQKLYNTLSLSMAAHLPINEEELNQILELEKNFERKDILYRIILNADIALLEQRKYQLEQIFPKQQMEEIENLISLATFDSEKLYEKLLLFGDNAEGKYVNEFDYKFGQQMAKELAKRIEIPTAQLMDQLVSYDIDSYNGYSNIFLARALYLRNAIEVTPILFKWLALDGDLYNEVAVEGLSNIGNIEIVETIKKKFFEETWDFRLFSPSILGRIKIKESEQALIELLQKEKEDLTIIANLCQALCQLGSIDGIPIVKHYIDEDYYDSGLVNLEDELYATCIAANVHLPELSEWRSNIEKDRKRLERNPFDFNRNDLNFDLFNDPMMFEKQKPVIVENKVGRNDPCPCGSGKKYKKCCGK